MKPHRGGLILALGIVSLVACAPCGIFAWVMGKNDLREMDAQQMDPTGRQQTNAGYVCGIIGSILMVLQILVLIGMMIFWFFAISSIPHEPKVEFKPSIPRSLQAVPLPR